MNVNKIKEICKSSDLRKKMILEKLKSDKKPSGTYSLMLKCAIIS
jgi:hypothetical protein